MTAFFVMIYCLGKEVTVILTILSEFVRHFIVRVRNLKSTY